MVPNCWLGFYFVNILPLTLSLKLFEYECVELIKTFNLFMLNLKVDMQIFGGNASTSMQSSVYCVGRSALASMVLVGFAYGGLIEGTHSAHAQQVDP